MTTMEDIQSLLGLPLDQLCLNENGVPTFIPVCSEFMMNFSDVEGIFRKCGSHTIVTNLGKILNYPDVAIPPSASIHDVTSFIKLWLRELPEPLIPSDIFNQYFVLDDRNSVITVIKMMPPINRKILAHLFAVVQLVTAQSAINHMTPVNMETCFVVSLVQNSIHYQRHLPFQFFFSTLAPYLNDLGNDFVFPDAETIPNEELQPTEETPLLE